MKNQTIILIFLYFCLTNALVMNNSGWGIDGVVQLVTISDQDITVLLFNLMISIIYLYVLTNRIDNFMKLTPYIAVRTPRSGLLSLLLSDIAYWTIFLTAMKLLADILFCMFFGMSFVLLYIALLYVLTFFFWGLVISFFALYKISKSVPYFLGIAIILVAQVGSYSIHQLSLFVVASGDLTDDVSFTLLGKLVLIIVTLAWVAFKANSTDFYGEVEQND